MDQESRSSVSTPDPTRARQPTLCVFCGAASGKSPAHLAAARALAQAMHRHGLHLVYGGGTVGLMGELARTLVALSGPDAVHGIIPSALIKLERSNSTTRIPKGMKLPDEAIYGKTTLVPDMHTRKSMMARAVIESGPGGGFVALSGGYGTMEELMEIVTWNQLGIHGRGVVVFNVEGYYDGLMQWLRGAVNAGFVAQGNSNIIVEAQDAEGVVQALATYRVAEGRYDLQWGKQ
ncbi:MAG: hypothetical protein M1826_002692 [Phylliscum demangeonii]|nr:MAG: hypothetical protein M1826_002692 [Phylliscum demangeonii]